MSAAMSGWMSAHTAVVPRTAPPPSTPPVPRATKSSASMSLHMDMSANPGGNRSAEPVPGESQAGGTHADGPRSPRALAAEDAEVELGV